MIRRAVLNPVFSNILMFAIVAVGIYYLVEMRKETFPNFSLNAIRVTIVQRGASPGEIEQGVCVKVEEEIHDIEGIKKLDSSAREGVGIIVAQLDGSVDDPQRKLAEIKTEVDKIDFASEAEKPVVTEVKAVTQVCEVALFGEHIDEKSLKILAEEVRNDLLALPDVTQVEIFGTRDYRILIQLSDQDLERLGLSFDQVVQKIKQESVSLPAGAIKGEAGEISIRTVGKRQTAKEYESIVLLSRKDGSRVVLGDVAKIVDGFEEERIDSYFDGMRAVQINVYKTADQDLIDISTQVREYVEKKRESLPEGVEAEVWVDYAPLLTDRLNLLQNNMLQGLFLVFLTLFCFLGFRIAFWATLGIPVCFLGSLAILAWWGGTLNMPSTFSFILVLGMLVDDAIVIAENVYVHWERGKPPLQAAVDGTREVWVPVASSSLTTAAAFAPAFFVAGDMGKLLQVIPVIVVGALIVSFIEAVFILPNHLGHSFPKRPKKGKKVKKNVVERFRSIFDIGMDLFVQKIYDPFLRASLRLKGLTIGVSIGLFLCAMAMSAGGLVEFVVMPEIDTDYVRVRFEMPPGTPIERTRAVSEEIEAAVAEINSEHYYDDEEYPTQVQRMATTVGATTGFDGEKGSHLGEVILSLRPSESGRDLTASQTLAVWREKVGDIPEVERFGYAIQDPMPTGVAIEVRLISEDIDTLRRAAAELKAKLREYPGVVDIADDDRKGKLEYQFRIKPEAVSQGVTVEMLARQLRQGFFGAEAVTIQRGREDVDVVVLFPESQRRHVGNLDDLKIRTPEGNSVPIQLVAERTLVRSIDTIRRIDRNRAITVSAGIDETRNNAEKVVSDLEQTGYFDEMLKKHPGMRYELAGQRGQSAESMDSLAVGMLVALGAIYVILVLTFRSFLQPFIIMSIIPLSFFGAIIGHFVLGHDLSLLSMVGFIGLAGIVVNDSLVLVEVINDSLARGESLQRSLVEGSKSRFRAIFLTSSTTFMGLVPMMAETSGQAKFLIPMAITIAFGVLFETFFVLILIPSTISAMNDMRRFVRWLRTGNYPAPEEVEPAVLRSRAIDEQEHDVEEEVALPEEIAAFGPSTAVAPMPAPGFSPMPAGPTSIKMPQVPASGGTQIGIPRMPVTPARPQEPLLPGGGQVTRKLEKAQSVDDLMEEAASCTGRDDYHGALNCYLAALRLQPNQSDIHFSVGLVRSRIGDWLGAAASFDRALELEPDNLDYREYRGWAHLRAGNYDAAARDFTARLDAEPQNLLAHKGRASALMALGKYDQAITDLDAAVEMAPRNADLYFLRGNAYRQQERHSAAIADYDRVLEARPDHARALFSRGQSRHAKGDPTGAIADFDSALAHDPDLHEAVFRRGQARVSLQQHQEAIADYSAYLAMRPDQSATYYFRGKARSAAGDVEGAVQDFGTFLQRNPHSKRRKMIERYFRQARRAGVDVS